MRKILFANILYLLTFASLYAQNHTIFNVRQYGATGKKDIPVTKNIQQAIDKCYETGGGEVYFPAGDYLTGHLELKDNVTLYLEAGATIWASRDTNDYKSNSGMKKSYEGGEAPSGDVPVLIYACKAKNISILGKGTINGRAQRKLEPLQAVDSFTKEETENARKAGVDLKMYYKVPPFTNMIIFDDCENVTVQDVSLIESESWTLHFKWCKKVRVEKVNIQSDLESGVNADGIDIDGCNDVLVDNCIVSTGDDAVVLKTTRTPDGQTRTCENVVVTNCILTTYDSALKLGTESFSDFKHIIFSNCIIRNTNRGLSIIIRDGSTASDVLFTNISIDCNRKYYFWWGNGDPIWLVVKKRHPDSKVGSIKNITFQNIIAHAQGTTKIEGFAGVPFENISISNMQIFMHPEGQPDKRATDAFYAHDVNDLSLKDVKVKWDTDNTEPLWSNAFSFENITNLYLENLKGDAAPGRKGSMIALNNVGKAMIENCYPERNTQSFLKLSGDRTQGIILNGKYSFDVEKSILKGDEIKANVLVK